MAKKQSSKSSAPKSKTKTTPHTTAIRGLLLFSASIAILLSLLSFAHGKDTHNWIGLIGFTTGQIFHAGFGLGSYLLCFYFIWIGWRLLFNKSINHSKIKNLYVFVMVTSLCVLLSVIEDRFPELASAIGNTLYSNLWQRKLHYHLGGAFFYYLYRDLPLFNLSNVLNTTGVLLLFSTTLLASLLFLTKTQPEALFKKFLSWVRSFKMNDELTVEEPEMAEDAPLEEEATQGPRLVKLRIPASSSNSQQTMPIKDFSSSHNQEMIAIQPDVNPTVRPSLSHKEQIDRARRPADNQEKITHKEIPSPPISQPKVEVKLKRKQKIPIEQPKNSSNNFNSYHLPSHTLIANAKKVDQSSLKQDLRRQAEVLEETLLSFGIEAKVGQINCGPTITSFEVHPAIGVKVQKIRTLENDIALNMEAKSIRIIAPIPGKAAVGIEVPNPHPQEVAFKDMLLSYQQGSRKFHIPVLLGKAVNGDYVMSDLTKMPHCIIAGATGSGKSVCINTIIMTILMTAKPDEIKLIMVDPKKVELTPYTRLPHMLAPVITEPQGACAALNWLVKEMENRYELLKQLGVRNIDSFNTRSINKELEDTLEGEIPERLPYIVVIIDELADLMMVSSNDIETPIARIAQMARAVGIHLILATQRPSREVITGIIKANFPTRISFKVASRVNSQIVLDESGAESLLGNGDLLFLPPGTSTLMRAQGAFIRDEDIAQVVNSICSQASPNYVIASFDALGAEESASSSQSAAPNDSLYNQASEIVINSGNASTTFLQRKLKIGYARAASLIDELEAKGVIGPGEGSKPRKIMTPKSLPAALPSQTGSDTSDQEEDPDEGEE